MRIVLLLLTALGLLAPAGPARADVEVYHPKHRTGEDLAPLAEAALGADGRVAVDAHTGALVLVGSGTAIAEALALLALQDRRLRTVRVTHETRSARALESAGYRVAWSVGGSTVRVGNVERGSSGVAVDLHSRRGAGEGSQAGTLRVLEGEWGRIARGTEVLLPTGSLHYPDAVRVAAESGLEVRPRILGDGRVRLDLRPFQARLGRGGVVSHAGADTTVVVTPGRTAVVGALGRAGSAASGSATGAQRSAGQRDELLLVTVAVEGDEVAPEAGP